MHLKSNSTLTFLGVLPDPRQRNNDVFVKIFIDTEKCDYTEFTTCVLPVKLLKFESAFVMPKTCFKLKAVNYHRCLREC